MVSIRLKIDLGAQSYKDPPPISGGLKFMKNRNWIKEFVITPIAVLLMLVLMDKIHVHTLVSNLKNCEHERIIKDINDLRYRLEKHCKNYKCCSIDECQ